MLYHYTTIPAMRSILRDAGNRGRMCFWATRYDCFADEKEYRLGVETIRRLLTEIEKGLQEDRRVAQDFDWELIEWNVNLPYPFIVSFTARPDNEYMWNEYAKDDGVVLEIDDSIFVPNKEMTMIMSKPCLYAGLLSDEELAKEIQNEYTFGGLVMLKGPMSKDAFELLEKHPQAFVRLIATYLLAFVATRIKGKDYSKEEETRVIIQSQLPVITEFVKNNRDTIQNALHLDPDELMQAMSQQRTRQRGDKVIFYRNFYIPVDLLRAVYTKSEYYEQVNTFIHGSVSKDIPVIKITSLK